MTKKKTAKKKRPVGRPRKYTLIQLQCLIDGYFNERDESEEPYTITGLAMALDTSRQSLMRWEKGEHELSDAIKKAKTRVEMCWEERLFSNSPTGAIFWLKNFGWTDKVGVEHSGTMTPEQFMDGTWPKKDHSCPPAS